MAQFSTAVRDARLQAIVTAFGSGGTLKVYTGTSPGVANSPTGTLLSTVAGLTFGTPSAGAVAATGTTDPAAAAAGTPGYVRGATSGGTALADWTAGVGSGECSFTAAVALAGSDALTSFAITEGNA